MTTDIVTTLQEDASTIRTAVQPAHGCNTSLQVKLLDGLIEQDGADYHDMFINDSQLCAIAIVKRLLRRWLSHRGGS